MFQRQDGTIYFNNNFHDKFLFVDYIWSGPEFEIITDSTTNTTEQEITKGKSGKVAAGGCCWFFSRSMSRNYRRCCCWSQ